MPPRLQTEGQNPGRGCGERDHWDGQLEGRWTQRASWEVQLCWGEGRGGERNLGFRTLGLGCLGGPTKLSVCGSWTPGFDVQDTGLARRRL